MATYLTELHDQGQARPFGAGGPGGRPRYLPTGRGTESGGGRPRARRLDSVIAGLLFMAGMRRSEVSALRWADVDDAAAEDEPGGRDEGRSVREGRRRPSHPDAQGRCEPGDGGPRRAALAEDSGATVQGGGPGWSGRLCSGVRARRGRRPLNSSDVTRATGHLPSNQSAELSAGRPLRRRIASSSGRFLPHEPHRTPRPRHGSGSGPEGGSGARSGSRISHSSRPRPRFHPLQNIGDRAIP